MKTLKERFEDKIYYSPDGCWYWTGVSNNKKRGMINVGGTNKLASRISYQLYKNKNLGKKFVCHSCDNGLCVNPDHLFLGTQKDNMNDMAAKGRSFKKLTKETVIEIRGLYKDKSLGLTMRSLSAMFNVHNSSIFKILNRISWKTI